MKIGVIVYSLSGHTLSVAERVQSRLAAAGHAVTLVRLETVGPAKLSAEDAALRSLPPVTPYEALVFGCPVRGGTPAPPMRRYLEQLPSLQGKQVACLVTHFFRPAWGADQALTQMRDLCEAKGATVRGSEYLRWFGLHRKQRIARVVDELSALF